MYDYIIKNGLLIDGTGAAPYQADLAVKDGKIARIAENISAEGKVIDASGLCVTPGFIDSHSHSDNAMLTYPDQIEKVEQGITTAIAGQCGGTDAPIAKEKADSEKDIAGMGKEKDILRTMGSLLDTAKDVPQGSNIAVFVGHRALRRAVCGPDNRVSTPDELEKMKELLIEGMEHGAMGVSFGLFYPPSSYAAMEELVALAHTAHEHGGIIAAHIRDERDKLLESTAEFIEILRRSGARGVLSHHKAGGKTNWGKVETTLRMLDEAVAEGIDIYCDVYPYTASHTSLSSRLIPKELHDRGSQGLVERLKDESIRAQIKEYGRSQWGDDLSWILVSSCAAYPEYIGKRLDEIAELHGSDAYDAAMDMIRDSGNVCGACYFMMCEEDVKRVLCYPRAMICTDASVAGKEKAYHPRLRGTFPRALGRYVREEKLMPLEEMIRKMTSLPAQVYGLHTKGKLAEGYDADLCVFDADAIIDCAEYAACHQRAKGLHYVFVGGEIAAENAVYTGVRRGKVLLRENKR
ncbi:MAG: D-aminoacylase [Clostridia bacterium]|nr:D-aminoacylase [Clostridia bacterium]